MFVCYSVFKSYYVFPSVILSLKVIMSLELLAKDNVDERLEQNLKVKPP